MRVPRLTIATIAGLLALSPVGPPPANAQEQTPVLGPPPAGKVQRISLTDGSQIVGRIVAVTDSTVQVESAIGMTSLRRTTIAKVRVETAGIVHNGAYYFPSPNTTRLLFGPTGRLLAKGEGYFADHDIFLPSFAVGISDNFTIGGGLTLIPGISPTQQMWFVTPKVGIVQKPSFNLAIGAFAGSIPSDFDSDANLVGVLYGAATWGKPDASFTTGLGYGFVNGEIAKSPVVMLGAETRAAPRLSFVTENYLFPGGTTTWSGGIRLFGLGVSVDLAGFAVVGDGETFCCAPFLGAMWKW